MMDFVGLEEQLFFVVIEMKRLNSEKSFLENSEGEEFYVVIEI